MKATCKGCNFNNLLEENRKILSSLVSEKETMINEDVVKQSQVLDDFITECIACQRRKDNTEPKEELDNVFGMHFSFYYYGIDHLMVNLIPYIKAGVENNELVTVSLSKDLYDRLIELLDNHGINREGVIFFPVKNLVLVNNEKGLEGLKEMITTFIQDIKKNNFTGARMIGQPSFAIGETSKEDFLKMEEVLNEAFAGMKASGFCIYDAFDYLNNRSIIDEDIIRKSFETHTYYLNHNLLNRL